MSDDIIGTTIDDYHIERALGQGGLGDVYFARNTNGESVAIKIIHPHIATQEAFSAQFDAYIANIKPLNHPHIISILASGKVDRSNYIISNYAEGDNLRTFIESYQSSGKRIEPEIAITIARQIASALAYAHGQGVYHRALKPEDVLFWQSTDNGEINVGINDFGVGMLIAKLSATTLGLPSTRFAYMPPEIVLEIPIDHRADIYTLGIILYELLTFIPPFSPRTIVEALQLHQNVSPTPIQEINPAVPEALAAIIMRCLKRTPDARYATAKDLENALDRIATAMRPSKTSSMVDAIEMAIVTDDEDDMDDVYEYFDTQPEEFDDNLKVSDNTEQAQDQLTPNDDDLPLLTEPDFLNDFESEQAHASIHMTEANDPGMDDSRRSANSDEASYHPEHAEINLLTLDFIPSPDDVLVINDGKGHVRRYKLVRDKHTIGRNSDNDIILDHQRVTRTHLLLERDQQGYWITDLGSTNGTWLDDSRLIPDNRVIWASDQILRMGDLWMHIEYADDIEATISLEEEDSVEADKHDPLMIYAQNNNSLDRNHDSIDSSHRVEAQLIPPMLQVVPGESGHQILEIINHHDRPNHYTITTDLPATWVSVPSHSSQVDANDSTHITLVIHPPRNSTTAVGTHLYTITIKSLDVAQTSTVVQGEIRISPFYNFNAELHPQWINNGQPTNIIIANNGNQTGNYQVRLVQYSNRIRFGLPLEQQITIPADQSINVPFTAKSVSGNWLRRSRTHPFGINIIDTATGEKRELRGSVVESSRIWLLAIAGLFMIGLIIFGVLVSLIIARRVEIQERNERQTQIAFVATSTAIAFATEQASDPDGDGLITSEEIAFSSNPLVADTDDDGLSDIEELAFGTLPDVADTDGDGAPDGMEVLELGTNPNDPDSNADSLVNTETPEPTLFLPSEPSEAVQNYYEQINNGNLDLTWTLITDQFRSNTGMLNRVDYDIWWNSVQTVIIRDVYTVNNDGNTACVFADLTYEMADGSTIHDNAPYVNLVRSPVDSVWRISSKVGVH